MPSYRDEEIYIECGLKYIKGYAPYQCNFEHPPLAKYFIGLSVFLGLSRHLYAFLYVGSVALIYSMCRSLGYEKIGLISAFLILYDTIFFNTHRFLLLDPFALFLSLLGLYLLLVNHVYISSIFMGLAISSKFSAIPVFFISTLLSHRGRGFSTVVKYIAIALLTYVSTYTADLLLGIDVFIKHHVDMYNYMSQRHGFSIPIALNGLLKLTTRIEYWVQTSRVFIYVYQGNGELLVDQINLPVNESHVVIGVGMGSVLWYTLYPLLLYATYITITRRGDQGISLFTYLSWISMVNVITGPLDWYYINVIPFLYVNAVMVSKKIFHRRFRELGVTLVILQLSLFAASVYGIIPFKVVFTK